MVLPCTTQFCSFRGRRAFTFIEAILVAVLVGMISGIGIIKYAANRDLALQNQIAAAVAQMDYVREKLNTTHNVGQMGLAATYDYVWAADEDYTMSFDASGTLTGSSNATIQQVMDRYLLRDERIGQVFRNYAQKGLTPSTGLALQVVYPFNDEASFTLGYDASASVWILQND